MNESRSTRICWWIAVGLVALTISACGGSDGDDATSADAEPAEADTDANVGDGDGRGSEGTAGTIGDAPPSGQATVVVDGLDLDFDLPGGLACTITDDSLTYSYLIGDNEVTLGAGANRIGDDWMGNITLTIANPEGEQGPITYYPSPGDAGVLDGSRFTIDGETAMYSGPMSKQPANDGTQPPAVDVGAGTVIASC